MSKVSDLEHIKAGAYPLNSDTYFMFTGVSYQFDSDTKRYTLQQLHLKDI